MQKKTISGGLQEEEPTKLNYDIRGGMQEPFLQISKRDQGWHRGKQSIRRNMTRATKKGMCAKKGENVD